MTQPLLLMKKMISRNPWLLVKSELPAGRFIAKTLAIDAQGNLWCWVEDADAVAGLPVKLKCVDKQAGEYLVASGNAITVLSPLQNGCLWKIKVSSVEYFRKGEDGIACQNIFAQLLNAGI